MKTLTEKNNRFMTRKCAARPAGVQSGTDLIEEMRAENRWDGCVWLLLAACATTIMMLSF